VAGWAGAVWWADSAQARWVGRLEVLLACRVSRLRLGRLTLGFKFEQ
jgi:hypothetical protein